MTELLRRRKTIIPKSPGEFSKIPQELKDLDQWLCWQAIPKNNGKVDKIPINPRNGRAGSSTDLSTWASFFRANRYYQKHKDNGINGVGFVFSKDDPYLGIDLDNCVDLEKQELSSETENYVQLFNSYTELTQSGQGIHIIIKGSLPGPRRRKDRVEMYESERYFVMTGQYHLNAPLTIERREKEIKKFYYDIFGREEEAESKPVETKPTLLSDEEILEKATSAKNGEKFSKLMAGDYSDYPSRSEADLALCNELAFWCGNNPVQIDSLFRQSKLCREKWDEKHGALTYGEMTIEKAVKSVTETYSQGDEEIQEEPHLTDLGNALRFSRMHGGNVHFCHPWHKWLIWDGKRWKVDDRGRIKRKAKHTILRIYHELDKIPDKDLRTQLFKHAVRSEADQRIKAMLSLAESEIGIPVVPDELDRDPWLLNVQNGTLDLKTGNLKPHSKEDFITKICPVPYNEDAECPKWEKFLNDIFDKNQDLISFMQRAVGYSLTGSTCEQCLFFLYGTGANGKTTFLEVILALFNDYARRADFSTFLVKYGESIRNDLARLKGARFVSAIETAEGKRLAEGIVKQLTGQDKVAARFLRQEFFEFQPEFKIWLAANSKPAIVGTDYAIWRRIKVVPFTITVPEKLQNPDLAAELKEELSGILSWAVEGCLSWQKDRLKEPKEVKSATANYKDDMDIIGDFLKDICTIKPDCEIGKGKLYENYAKWCEESGEKKISKKKFGMCILDRGFDDYSDGNTKYWMGIELRE